MKEEREVESENKEMSTGTDRLLFDLHGGLGGGSRGHSQCRILVVDLGQEKRVDEGGLA